MPDDLKNTAQGAKSSLPDVKEELEKIKGFSPEDANRAMLYMLEDLNETVASVSQAKKDWEETVDSLSDPLFTHDIRFRILKCNRAYQSLAGLPFKSIIGRPYFEVFPKMEGPLKSCLEALEADGETHEEIEVPSTGRVFKIRAFPRRDENGKYLYSVHIMEDITGERLSKAALEESEEKFRSIASSARDAIIMTGGDGGISFWNRAAEEIFGYTAAEALGKELHSLMMPERYHEAYRNGIEVFRETGQGPALGKTLEIEALRKDGTEFPVELSVSSVRLRGAWSAIGILRDITERKAAERKIQEETEITRHLLMIAEAASQYTDLDRLLGSIAHCVRGSLRCNACLTYLWDAAAGVFRPKEESGLDQAVTPVFKAGTLSSDAIFIRPVLDSGVAHTFRREDMDSSALEGTPFAATGGPGSLTVIPLASLARGPLGLLVCVSFDPGASPPPGDTVRFHELVRGIGWEVSVAVEQALLHRDSINKAMELSRMVETIRVMNEIDRSILSTLEPQTILETATRMIAMVIPCDNAAVALVDEERKGLVYRAGSGFGGKKDGFIPHGETSATEVVKTMHPASEPNLKLAGGSLLPHEKELADAGLLSLLRVPLMVKGRAAGVLSVAARRPAAFGQDDLSTLEKLSAQVGVALENSRLLKDVEDLFLSTVRTLSNAIDAKSPWTRGHSDRVTKLALLLGKEAGLGKEELRALEIAGLLHDIGKLGTYEAILDKPGKLTEEELAVMRQHPVKAVEILEPIRQLKDIIVPAIRGHHEHYDGSGYPDGLKGEETPFMARILSIADTVDAMSADRPYRKGKTREEIIDELQGFKGMQFDPGLVDVFLGLNPEFS